MRLLNSRSQQLELLYRDPPRYAIVSHRWGDDSEEVLFTDIGDQVRTQSKGKGYERFQGSCAQAMQDGIGYVWLDTCCIDRNCYIELGEAINSMFKWYHESAVCYAHLHDVSDPSRFTESDWFTRGWTLQELIAPKRLKFFTKDWTLIGTREDLIDPIAQRTGISPDILRSSRIPPEVSISQKMAWARERETTRVEDKAYALLGILGVNMFTIYGIGNVAFQYLQHHLATKSVDQSLFAWYHASTPSRNTTGLFASSPSQYLKSYEISEADFRKIYMDDIRDRSYRSQFFITNNLVRISAPIKHVEGKIWKAILRCSLEPPDGNQIQRPLVIYLKEIQPLKFVRIHFPRNVEEGGEVADDDQTSSTMDVPGSLERLSDAELRLEGYILREIDVLCQHGESDSGGQPRPPSDDPDALPDPGNPIPSSSLPDQRDTSMDLLQKHFGHIPDLTSLIKRLNVFPDARGSYADIYKCRLRQKNGRYINVAVKVFRFQSCVRPQLEAPRGLRREIKVWHALRHRNIVPLLGVVSGFGAMVSAVSPWISGGPLRTYLDRRSEELVLSDRYDLIGDVAEGIKCLHSFPIVHGDLSDGNVLVEDDGTARLSDFGLCTVVGGVSAPELILNGDTAEPTKMSDIYSLGCIMLQILSGQPPWENENEARIILALNKGEHVPRPEHRSICDRDWAIIQQCCLPANVRPSIGEVLDYISVQRASLQESQTASTASASSPWELLRHKRLHGEVDAGGLAKEGDEDAHPPKRQRSLSECTRL